MNIDGHNIPFTYKGILHYETAEKHNYPDSYNATIHYIGRASVIDPVYLYTVTYKEIEPAIEEEKENYIVPVIIISSVGIIFITIFLIMHKQKIGGQNNVK